MEHIINKLLDYGCKLTPYNFNDKPVLFCLAVHVSDPKEIWHIANLCNDESLEVGQPQYDKDVPCLYFPACVLDERLFKQIVDA